jgi:hypothetical protein
MDESRSDRMIKRRSPILRIREIRVIRGSPSIFTAPPSRVIHGESKPGRAPTLPKRREA